MQLNIQVPEDGTGVAQGKYQLLILKTGVKLVRSGKLPIDVPVGSRVRSYPNATLHVVTEQRLDFEMRVLGMMIANQRLADDLATFLKKQGPPPNVDDYRVPYYLFALSALPFGLVVITLGGGLWMAFAGALFAGCLAVVKRHDLPLVARLAILALINVLGYGVAITVVVSLFLWKRGNPPIAAAPPASAIAALPAAAAPVIAPTPATVDLAAAFPLPPISWNVPIESVAPPPEFPPVIYGPRRQGRRPEFTHWQHLPGSPGEFLARMEGKRPTNENFKSKHPPGSPADIHAKALASLPVRMIVRGKFDLKTGEITEYVPLNAPTAGFRGLETLIKPPADVDSQGRLALVTMRTEQITKQDKPYAAKPGVDVPKPSVTVTDQTIYSVHVWGAGQPDQPLFSLDRPDLPWIGWDASGRLLVIAGGKLAAWDVATGKQVFEFPGKYSRAAALAPSRRWIVVAGEPGNVDVLDTGTGKSIGRPQAEGLYQNFAISMDGQQLAGVSVETREFYSPKRLHVWDLATGNMLLSSPMHVQHGEMLIWLGSDQIAIGDTDTATVFDLKSQSVAGELQATFPIPASPNGKMWFSCFTLGSVYFTADFQLPEPAPGDLAPGTKVAIEVQTGDVARDQQLAATMKGLLARHRFVAGDGAWKLVASAGFKDSGFLTKGVNRFPTPSVAGKVQLISPQGGAYFTAEPNASFLELKSRYFVRRTDLKGNEYKHEFDFKDRDPRVAISEEVWDQFLKEVATLTLPREAHSDGSGYTSMPRKIPLQEPPQLGKVLNDE